MPDLNLDIHYFEHPKTRRLVSLLGCDADVLPIRLWAYASRVHADTGKLPGYSAQEVESLIGWRGKPGRAVDALITVGFLHPDGDGFVIHDWLEHEGHLATFKRRAKIAAEKRWFGHGNATSMLEACFEHATSNAPTKPTKPIRQAASAASGEPPAAAAPAPRTEFPIFPCVRGRKSSQRQWELTNEYIDELQQTFPAIDVKCQCRRAWQWVVTTTAHHKTAGGMKEFLRKWMAREQDKGRTAGSSAEAQSFQQDQPEFDDTATLEMLADVWHTTPDELRQHPEKWNLTPEQIAECEARGKRS